MTGEWIAGKIWVYDVNHMVFCSKYRLGSFGEHKIRLWVLLFKKISKLIACIVTSKIGSIGLLFWDKALSIRAPSFIIGQLKGYWSRAFCQRFPQLKSELVTLWTCSYYLEATDKISEAIIGQYIEDQKGK